MKIVALLVLMALTAWLASAADIDGKWTAETKNLKGGELTEVLSLKSAGNKLTGSAQRSGSPVDISDGVIKGNDVSFTVVRPGGVTQKYKGSLSGGALKLTMDGSRGLHREMVFKKAGS
jgi:opacity protein-like surface antigen